MSQLFLEDVHSRPETLLEDFHHSFDSRKKHGFPSESLVLCMTHIIFHT